MNGYKRIEKKCKLLNKTYKYINELRLNGIIDLSYNNKYYMDKYGILSNHIQPSTKSYLSKDLNEIITFKDPKHNCFYIFPNALTINEQNELATKCLTEYIELPHHTNCTDIYNKKNKKISWAQSGYHYDWASRTYNQNNKSPIPIDLKNVAIFFTSFINEIIEPEAVIINYYDKHSYMGGHQDDVEEILTKPVVSISLGRTAIFLKGTETKDDEPLALLVKAGDIILLSGPSRLSYHGIPCLLKIKIPVLSNQKRIPKSKDIENEDNNTKITHYLEENRININIRQVYK